MRFEFATAAKIFFGPGSLKEAGPAARQFGQRVLIVAGKSTGHGAVLNRLLGEHGCTRWTFASSGEPDLEQVERGARLAREERVEAVISIGGGSAIDLGKAIAAVTTNRRPLRDYLEVVGLGLPLDRAPLPFIAIPTTAGTGAEVTRNAVLGVPDRQLKVSLRSPLMLPRLAIVDPELTLGLSRALTASTGLDALTQLIEPLVSCRANPLTDALCREGLPRVARSLRRACESRENFSAREDMSLAALFSGLALANAGLGAVHGFAAPLGGMFPAPHGAVCAALLPHVTQMNLRALRQRQPEGGALARYDEVARLLTGNAGAQAEDAVNWLHDTCRALEIPPLRQYGMTAANVSAVCERAAQASSMKGNPLPLTTDELHDILHAAL